MRKVLVVTGSRGEWGYIRPVLRLIAADPALDYAILVTHMHLLSEFGMSIGEIERDGFRVDERIYMTFDGYNATTMSKSLGVLLLELPGALERIAPDIVLLAGDRGEQLMTAIAAVHLGIPVAHIQAGELSGNVDGIVRHAITKLAHLHFAANDEFANRVRRLGEQHFRVFVTGAPLVDELVAGEYTAAETLIARHRFERNSPTVLAVQHPVTEEESSAGDHVAETLHALIDIGWQTVMIYPNADAGSAAVRGRLAMMKRPNIRLLRNLPRADYLGLMRMVTVMVGNSSSGIMEAPSFGTPVVNIGRRQRGRPQATNVINVDYDRSAIREAVLRAVTPEFRAVAKGAANPYGDGKAAHKIVDILKHVEINDVLLRKELTY